MAGMRSVHLTSKKTDLQTFLRLYCSVYTANKHRESLKFMQKPTLPGECRIVGEHIWTSATAIRQKDVSTLCQLGCKGIISLNLSKPSSWRQHTFDQNGCLSMDTTPIHFPMPIIHVPMIYGAVPTEAQVCQILDFFQQHARHEDGFICIQNLTGKHIAAPVLAIENIFPGQIGSWPPLDQHVHEHNYMQAYLLQYMQHADFPYPSPQLQRDMLTSMWCYIRNANDAIKIGNICGHYPGLFELNYPTLIYPNPLGDSTIASQLRQSWLEQMSQVFRLALAGTERLNPEDEAEARLICRVVEDNPDLNMVPGWTYHNRRMYENVFN